MKNKILLLMACFLCVSSVCLEAALKVDDLAVRVDGQREFSFSDKRAGFFYGMTGVNNWNDGNAGWNIEARRVFADYSLFVDGKELDRTAATTVVYPDRLERSYSNATETFSLADNKKVILLAVDALAAKTVSVQLNGDWLPALQTVGGKAVAALTSHQGKNLCVVGLDGSPVTADNHKVTASASAGGFVIAFGTAADVEALAADAVANHASWSAQRKARIQAMLDKTPLATDDTRFDKALAWLTLTADELVTWQHGGWGIYAGFPWFTDFWGRDMFIAMPGTVLCSGNFDVAKNILLSFAKYQDTDKQSETYGRVPNRLNLDGILYNTTDGTPRFVMQVLDYLNYTGDKSFIKQIYKNVKIATDASIDLYTDGNGYLTHADADTWMDAKRQSKYPCSPRGNRAVDIQALWYEQLVASVKLAEATGHKSDAKRWQEIADKLKANFNRDFVVDGRLVDHLNEDGTADSQLRPNTMFAYGLLSDGLLKRSDIKTIWSRLTYPWGVSSLDQMDDQFHPYNEQWYRYHKDDAYHNGTVWLWLNGMAMQRMIEFNQEGTAFRLFENMNRQALDEGAVGSLSECADAWCRPGQTWARRSGTFLQSWSNSEQLRVWSQYFLGVRPNLLDGKIVVAPRLPQSLAKVATEVNLGDGKLHYDYSRAGNAQSLILMWTGKNGVALDFDIEGYADCLQQIKAGQQVTVKWDAKAMTVAVGGKQVLSVAPDAAKKQVQTDNDAFFRGVDFAQPCYREDLKSMSRYFNPPLDYFSVE